MLNTTGRGGYEFFRLTRIIGNWNLSGRWKWFVNWVSGLWVTCGTSSVIRKFCWKLCGRDALGPFSFGLCTSNNHGSPPGSRCHCKHLHPSSHLLPRSTTTVRGGHYYSALRHLVRLWRSSVTQMESGAGTYTQVVCLQGHVLQLQALYYWATPERHKKGSWVHNTTSESVASQANYFIMLSLFFSHNWPQFSSTVFWKYCTEGASYH